MSALPHGQPHALPHEEDGQLVVCAFYRFVAIEDPEALRQAALAALQARGVKGTLLIAAEGVNAALAGSREAMDAFLAWLQADPRFAGLAVRESHAAAPPFKRTKVKIKQEIVTLGLPGLDPCREGGARVAPKDWNALVQDPETLLIDVRNRYETSLGSFPGALNPGTGSFREFPAYADKALDPARHRKLALFCTGGIRCEKASAYLRRQGFAEVQQLQGGILRYLEETPPNESLWQGQCFVFDSRLALDPDLAARGLPGVPGRTGRGWRHCP